MRRLIIILAVLLVVLPAGCGAAAATKDIQPEITSGTVAKGTPHQTTARTTAEPTESGTAASTSENDQTEKNLEAMANERTHNAESAHLHTAEPADLVTVIGDSVMLGAVDALERKIPNLVLLDAQGSRQPPAAIDILRQYRADNHLGDIVVVHIGNNGIFTAQEFDQMMAVLSSVRKVLIVNATVPPDVEDPIAVPNDAVLADGAQRYPKAVLVDWYSRSAGHPEYFWDGIHLTPEGAQAYADLISSYVGEPKGSVELPGPRKEFFWGEGGLSGECVGPASWCLGVVRQ
jgi:hypothetical protein